MKLLFIFFIVTFLSAHNYSQENNKMEKVNSIIKELKEKFAPDKRVVLFNIEAVESENKIILKGETNIHQAYSEFSKMMSDAEIKFDNQIEMLPSEKLGEKKFGVINLSVANMRSKPDHPAELTTQSILGTPIKILKKAEDGYYLVQTPDNYISWLDDDGFTFMTEDQWKEWQSSPKIIYTK